MQEGEMEDLKQSLQAAKKKEQELINELTEKEETIALYEQFIEHNEVEIEKLRKSLTWKLTSPLHRLTSRRGRSVDKS